MAGRNVIRVLFLAMASLSAFAEEGKTHRFLQAYLATDGSTTSLEKYENFVAQVEKKQSVFRSETDFARFVFYKAHQKFLKHYQPYTSFGDLLQSGRYNCLTAVALYALLLDHFEIDHQIIETNYHTFILATLDGSQVLLEATDPLGGFVENKKEQEKRLTKYRSNALESTVTNGVLYEFQFNLWETVSLSELTGLLYFNQAVDTFNKQQLENSVAYLVHAGHYRPSARMKEFSSVVMASVASSDLPHDKKEQLILQLREVRKQSVQWMAASAGL